jgi:hypothetical protein
VTPFEKGGDERKPGRSNRFGSRLKIPGPTLPDGLRRLNLRKSLFPVGEWRGHAFYIVVIFSAAGAVGEMIFNAGTLPVGEDTAREETEVCAVMTATV